MKIKKEGIGNYDLLVRQTPDASIFTHIIGIALGYNPLLQGKTLLLKAAFTLAAGHMEIYLKLTRISAGQLLSCWKVKFQVLGVGTKQWFLPRSQT